MSRSRSAPARHSRPVTERQPSASGPAGDPATYASAGVDIAAAERTVDLIRPLAGSTHGAEVIGGLGGFGGLFELAADRYRQPVLVAGTDGIGTKALVAQQVGRFDTVGLDLVAMVVDDLVCQGAEPLFLLDYISVGSLDPAHVADLVAGVAEGCRQVGAALLGGETAEHPGIMEPGEFDLVGFAVGVVERDDVLGAGRVRVGDVLLGLPSPGLRSNGYTLARHVLCDRAGLPLDGPAWPGAAASLGEELLRPSVIYTPAVRAAMAAADVHAAAHITGGGFPGNIPRMLPEETAAVLDPVTWEVPPIFSEIRRHGGVTEAEMRRVFNLGLGMVVAVAADTAADAIAAMTPFGVEAREVGQVEAAESSPSGEDDRLVFTGRVFQNEDGGAIE